MTKYMTDKEFFEYSNTPEMLKLRAEMDELNKLHPPTFQCTITPYEPDEEK